MWPLPIHFTAALCGNQAWIIKVSSEQWSIHWGPCSQTARPYFSRNDIENTWVCFQTMHINVKYARPNMSIIITVQAEAMSGLILRKWCWVTVRWAGFTNTWPFLTERGEKWLIHTDKSCAEGRWRCCFWIILHTVAWINTTKRTGGLKQGRGQKIQLIVVLPPSFYTN